MGSFILLRSERALRASLRRSSSSYSMTAPRYGATWDSTHASTAARLSSMTAGV